MVVAQLWVTQVQTLSIRKLKQNIAIGRGNRPRELIDMEDCLFTTNKVLWTEVEKAKTNLSLLHKHN